MNDRLGSLLIKKEYLTAYYCRFVSISMGIVEERKKKSVEHLHNIDL